MVDLELMEQPLVCQNPFSWNTNHEWIADLENISIRLKADKLSLADYYATKNTYSKLSIEAISDLTFEARVSKNFMVETKGSLIDKIERFANGEISIILICPFFGAPLEITLN